MTHKKHEVGFANNGSDNHGFTFSAVFLLLEGDLRKKKLWWNFAMCADFGLLLVSGAGVSLPT